MSKDASDLFANMEVDAQLSVIVSRFLKGLPLSEWERAALQAKGITLDENTRRTLSALDFLYKYGATSNQKAGSYTEVKAAFKGILHGYHTTEIKRGKYGERSKILEEMAEVEDAHKQGNWIMLQLELSDLVGAIHGYLAKHNMTMNDLQDFANAAFQPVPFSALVEIFHQFRNPGGIVSDFRRLDQMLWYIGCYVLRFNLQFADVLKMMETTHRAFEAGHRKPKEVA